MIQITPLTHIRELAATQVTSRRLPAALAHAATLATFLGATVKVEDPSRLDGVVLVRANLEAPSWGLVEK